MKKELITFVDKDWENLPFGIKDNEIVKTVHFPMMFPKNTSDKVKVKITIEEV